MNNTNIPEYQPPALKPPILTPEGFKIVAQNDHLPVGCSCFVGCFSLLLFLGLILILGGFSIGLILVLLYTIRDFINGNYSLWNLIVTGFWAGFVTIFFTLALWSIGGVLRGILASFQRSRKFDRAGELFLSHHPLKLGESYQIRFCRPLRSGTKLKKNGTLKARLLCSEVVTYTVGTDDVTVRHIIQEQPLIEKNLLPGTQIIEFTASIEIPKHSAPSFAAKNNQILWEIEVNLELEGLVSTDKKMGGISMLPNGTLSTFAFCVDPEIVS